MKLIPPTEEWYTWLAKKQPGYFYPGRKILHCRPMKKSSRR